MAESFANNMQANLSESFEYAIRHTTETEQMIGTSCMGVLSLRFIDAETDLSVRVEDSPVTGSRGYWGSQYHTGSARRRDALRRNLSMFSITPEGEPDVEYWLLRPRDISGVEVSPRAANLRTWRDRVEATSSLGDPTESVILQCRVILPESPEGVEPEPSFEVITNPETILALSGLSNFLERHIQAIRPAVSNRPKPAFDGMSG